METKHGFTKLDINELGQWLESTKVARTVMKVQQHHTWLPNYSHFSGDNHFERQKAMKDHHVINNGWNDIGQHFTVFPDGMILTGRSLESSPACITGQNANSVCIENLGDFDVGGDTMTEIQKDTIVALTAKICQKFNLSVDTNCIVYHHWFELGTGLRNNGIGGNKSCPGTNFFGGNKVEDCEKFFLPLVKAKMNTEGSFASLNTNGIQYAMVTASRLNVRSGPDIQHPVVTTRNSVVFGAILRIYEEKDHWQKISKSETHWVSARYTKKLERAMVNAGILNVRSGPGTTFSIIDTLQKGEEIFIFDQREGWSKISMDEKWVSSSFLDF